MDAFLKPLDLDPVRLTKLTIEFGKVFTKLARNSDNQFLPTPICMPPAELAELDTLVLAIDVGGSHLRVGLFSNVEKKLDLLQGGDYHVISDSIKGDTAEGLFDLIGERIVSVLEKYLDQSQSRANEESKPCRLTGPELPVGVTFSFPVIQDTISTATLMPLGKGFTMQPGAKLDRLLLSGYAPHADASSYTLPKLVVKAITNDTIATMVASTQYAGSSTTSSTHAYSEDTSASKAETVMGLIVATGMNATIALPPSALSPHKTSNLTLPFETGSHDDKHKILINTEFSINGSAPPLRSLGINTKWDEFVDAKSAAPGFQPLEYMTSGRYLGELVRVIFVDYITTVCDVDVSDIPPRLRLKEKDALNTEYLSTIVAAAKSPRKLAEEKLQVDFPPAAESTWVWTPEYAEALITIARRVQIRSSRLIAAASMGLLLCSGDIRLKNVSTSTNGNGKTHHEPRELTIAYSGAVIEKYPMYLATCQETIDALFFSLCQNEDGVERIVLRHVEEGGLFGAAVLAVVEVGKEKNIATSSDNEDI